MAKQKRLREKGKINLSRYFKEFKVGDRVALTNDLSVKGGSPKQFLGRTGTIIKKDKNAYMVKFLNGKIYKYLILKPIHIKKLT
jgi:ribosomal protein L21E